MARSSILAWRGQRFRVTPWRGEGSIAHVAVDARGSHPSVDGVARCVDRVGQAGFDRILTAALHDEDLAPFLHHGFQPVEQLVVLAHDLHELPPAPSYRMRSFRLRHRPQVLGVDGRAFEEFWQLDDAGLDEAFGATPRARGRYIRDGTSLLAYGIVGVSGTEAFLQRLAVDPQHQGVGMGRALTADALEWAVGRGAKVAFVNTQATNAAALGLYSRLGFQRRQAPLTVLELSVRSEAVGT